MATQLTQHRALIGGKKKELNIKRAKVIARTGKPPKALIIASTPRSLTRLFLLQVFDAADKEVSDEEVGKKGGKKPASDAKDPAEAMGDMLSSFFGGGKK